MSQGYTPSAEVAYPCADYKPGDDDLQSFDFIRKFELDVNLDGYPGVARCDIVITLCNGHF